MEEQRNKLILPLPNMLVKFIKFECPDNYLKIVSTIENTAKNSRNPYVDVMRALEPLLRNNTKAFVDKIFMFRKRMCKNADNCHKNYCLFAHSDEELVSANKRINPAEDSFTPNKKFKIDNNEVIFNKVDENVYTVEQLKQFSSNYGTVTNVRRLNKGKYLICFEDPDCARNLVESLDLVLNDPEIKKFFNVNVPLDQNKKVDINSLFDEQQDCFNKLANRYDPEVFNDLKMVCFKIRHHVVNSEKKTVELIPDQYKIEESENSDEIQTSIYYNILQDNKLI